VTDYLDFNETRLSEQLERLPRGLRVAFATACAERLHGPYAPFADEPLLGDPGELSTMLERLWSECEADAPTPGWAERSVARLDRLMPHDDDVDWSMPGQAEARDFAFALIYALDAHRTGRAREAVLAANYVYESLWSTVANGPASDLNAPGGREAAVGHPLVQAELGRQERDLADLLGDSDARELIRGLRERAREESLLLRRELGAQYQDVNPDGLVFDFAWLIDGLMRLAPRLRVAFAAACTERLRPAYARHQPRTGKASDEATADLEHLWRDCEAGEAASAWARGASERLGAATAHIDLTRKHPAYSASEAFALALHDSLDAHVSGYPLSAAVAAQRGYQVLEDLVFRRSEAGIAQPGAFEAALRGDPPVQAELARQRRDLDDLLRADDEAAAIGALRTRAETEDAVPEAEG
jgi:uncharacterized protein YjaG (DUF416 family)